jgi:hypothetical protein
MIMMSVKSFVMDPARYSVLGVAARVRASSEKPVAPDQMIPLSSKIAAAIEGMPSARALASRAAAIAAPISARASSDARVDMGGSADAETGDAAHESTVAKHRSNAANFRIAARPFT